jgi:hypothetical protein
MSQYFNLSPGFVAHIREQRAIKREASYVGQAEAEAAETPHAEVAETVVAEHAEEPVLKKRKVSNVLCPSRSASQSYRLNSTPRHLTRVSPQSTVEKNLIREARQVYECSSRGKLNSTNRVLVEQYVEKHKKRAEEVSVGLHSVLFRKVRL